MEAGLVNRSKASHLLSMYGTSELQRYLPDSTTGVTFVADRQFDGLLSVTYFSGVHVSGHLPSAERRPIRTHRYYASIRPFATWNCVSLTLPCTALHAATRSACYLLIFLVDTISCRHCYPLVSCFIMVALCNRADHYIFPCDFYLLSSSSFFFFLA